jgi:signal peptidase
MEKKKKSIGSRVLTVLSITLIVILSLILVANLTLIIKGAVNDDKAPSLFGVTPLVVLSGSMEGDNADSFDAGALIFVVDTDVEKLNEGDVIAFFDPASTKKAIVTHRIVEITTVDGELAFYTKGDNNNAKDDVPVKASNVIGEYSFHLNGVGNFALFLQRPLGMLLFIGIPVIGFIVYDIIRRKKSSKQKDKKTEELEAEIARLRALSNQSSEEAPVEQTSEAKNETLEEAPTEVASEEENKE